MFSETLSVGEILLYAAGLARDFAAFAVALSAAFAFLELVIRAVLRRPFRLPPNMVEGALFAFIVGVAGCFGPPEFGMFLSLPAAVGLLVMGTCLWVLVLLIGRRLKPRW